MSGFLAKSIGLALSMIIFVVIVITPLHADKLLDKKKNNYNTSSYSVSNNTRRRAKLSPDKCHEINSYYTDELDWIHNSTKLERGMKTFYQKTGIQPYLYICDNIDGDRSGNYTLDKQEDFGNDLYDKYFEDEGHVILVFCEYRDSEYVCFTVAGRDAKTILDDDGREILLDSIDDLYYSDLEDEEFFSKAFENAAKKLMGQ